jgi:thymidine kinase
MGKLYFKYGAMSCGKTTQLLQVVYNYEKNGFNVLLVKPAVDKKGEDTVVSRIGASRKVDLLLDKNDKLVDKVDVEKLDSIVVDESQFLSKEQVKELWLISKLYDIPVITYGLKTNFLGELFPGSKALIEKADEIDELVTICSCSKKAKFNVRIVNGNYASSGEEISIDGIDSKYEAMCPECYIDKVLKIKKI